MANIYANLINQYKFKHHILFPASFYKINEEDQRSDENDLFNNLNIFHNLIESDFINIDVNSQLENQIRIKETKDSGWIFGLINSIKIGFFKTAEINGSSYVKIPLRSNAILNSENIDTYCFIWSLSAKFPPR